MGIMFSLQRKRGDKILFVCNTWPHLFYEEVVVGKSTPTVDENYAECVDDCNMDDDLMPWEDEETVVASCSSLPSRD